MGRTEYCVGVLGTMERDIVGQIFVARMDLITGLQALAFVSAKQLCDRTPQHKSHIPLKNGMPAEPFSYMALRALHFLPEKGVRA